MKNKIVSIEIQLTDYEPIKFKMNEARELYEQLHELFGDKEQHNHYHGSPWYQRPYYTWCNATNAVSTTNNTVSTIPTSGTITCAADLAGKSVQSSQTDMKVSYLSQ